MRSLAPWLVCLLIAAACSSSGSSDEADSPALPGKSGGSGGKNAAGAGGGGAAGGAAGAGAGAGQNAAGTSAGEAGAGGSTAAAGQAGAGAGAGGSAAGAGGSGAGAGGAGALSRLLVVIRTGSGQFDGTDDGASFCVAPGRCFGLDNAEINDRESGSVDHHELDATGLTLADIEQISLTTDPGDNAWKPTCIAVVADGDLLYCNDQLGSLVIGSQGSETKTFIDKNVSKKTCQSCYGGGPITHGPMVGHTTPSEARIWARAGSSRDVRVRYGTAVDLAGASVSAQVKPAPDHDFTAEIKLEGLTAATTYRYAIEVDGVAVTAPPYPSFRTAPAAQAKASFAFGSCARVEKQEGSAWEGFPVFDAIAAAKPDVMLMVGDNHYANTTDTARLRFFYRQSRDVSSFARLVRQTPTWAIWDDHDYGDNNTDGTFPGKERSLAAFDDYWANPSLGSGGTPGIWYSFSWGDVDFFMLDDRYHRIGASMLGAEQKAWLLSGLAASKASFKVIASGSVWNDDGSSDSWAAFKAERDSIFDEIMAKKIPGVVLISGDIHRSAAFLVRGKSASGYPLHEFTSSPLGNTGGGCGTHPSIQFCYSGDNYFGLIKTDTSLADPTLSFELHDQAGTLLDSISTKRSDLTL